MNRYSWLNSKKKTIFFHREVLGYVFQSDKLFICKIIAAADEFLNVILISIAFFWLFHFNLIKMHLDYEAIYSFIKKSSFASCVGSWKDLKLLPSCYVHRNRANGINYHYQFNEEHTRLHASFLISFVCDLLRMLKI